MSDPALPGLLDEVAAARFVPEDWRAVEAALASLESGSPSAVTELGQVVFEARVRRRFAGGRAGASVAPTKQTSVLPWVGLVCGGLLAGMGTLLGGGVILVGIGALGLFVFGVAFAGSRVAHRQRPSSDEPLPDPVGPPPAVQAAVARLRARIA